MCDIENLKEKKLLEGNDYRRRAILLLKKYDVK